MKYKYPDHYKFTEKWFDHMLPSWKLMFDFYLKESEINSVLEIGCYEGRASTFLLDSYLSSTVTYDVVDTFGGSEEEAGMKDTMERLKSSDFIYENFTHNISFHPNIELSVYRERSQYALPELVKHGREYDFIYIDASHMADDTFVDGYYAHRLLRPGGLIIFDDFGWKDPTRPHASESPELGIKTFFKVYSREYDTLRVGYQVAAIKHK